MDGWKEIDSTWPEVEYINKYAVFMSALSNVTRGLQFLVVTWTSVVLLGGFVSVLEKKDFWSLTVITLVETAGVLDYILRQELGSFEHIGFGLQHAMLAAITGPTGEVSYAREFVAEILSLIQLVVIVILRMLLLILTKFGLFISTGISLWRLIQHDYGSTEGGGNLKPALDVLYSLSVAQGVFYSCWIIYLLGSRGGLVTKVAREGLRDMEDQVRDYLGEAVVGCEKSSSFCTGRNLVTYAVGLMDSESPDSYLRGVRVLDGLIRHNKQLCGCLRLQCHKCNRIMKQHLLMKYLLLVHSVSSSHRLHKLVLALDRAGPYKDDQKIRECAASVVEFLAGDIHLEQLPQGIQCIGSLLVVPQQQDGADCKELLLQGLRILRKMAIKEDNCLVISNTRGVLSRIMAAVTLDLLHAIDHEKWFPLVQESLELMSLLAATPGEGGTRLRYQISSNKKAVASMDRILKCDQCGTRLKMLVIEILKHLYLDTSLRMPGDGSREIFIKTLLNIFTGKSMDKDSSIRQSGGEALEMLSLVSENSSMMISKASDGVLGGLTEILLGDANNAYRISAARILEHLYMNSTKDDAHLNKLKDALTAVMPELFREMVPSEAIGEATQTRQEPKEDKFSAPGVDIEGQYCPAGVNDDRENTSSSQHRKDEQHEDKKLQAALLSLCVTILEEQDLAFQFYATPTGDGQLRFIGKLTEMVKRNSQPTTNCLRILKLTCKMVITMVKHGDSHHVNQDLGSLMESLSSVSKMMLDLDGLVLLSGIDGGTSDTLRSLISLVEEAQELLQRAQE